MAGIVFSPSPCILLCLQPLRRFPLTLLFFTAAYAWALISGISFEFVLVLLRYSACSEFVMLDFHLIAFYTRVIDRYEVVFLWCHLCRQKFLGSLWVWASNEFTGRLLLGNLEIGNCVLACIMKFTGLLVPLFVILMMFSCFSFHTHPKVNKKRKFDDWCL